MHAALDDSPGVKNKLFGLLAKAWTRGRRGAVNKLVESAGAAAGGAEKRFRRVLELRLPQERPFHVEDITATTPSTRTPSRIRMSGPRRWHASQREARDGLPRAGSRSGARARARAGLFALTRPQGRACSCRAKAATISA